MNAQPQKDTLYALLEAYFLPLLQGAELSGPLPLPADAVHPRRGVTYDTRHRLCIRPEAEPGYYQLTRAIPFTEAEKEFLARIMESLPGSPGEAPERRVEKAVDRAVALTVAPGQAGALLQVIETYSQWAAQADGPAHTVGLYAKKQNPQGESFSRLAGTPSIRSVGASQDTLLALGKNGEILKVESIAPVPVASRAVQRLYAPVSQADVALWARSPHKTAVRLTRQGEIFVFRAKRLLFVKKNTVWRALPHTLISLEGLIDRTGALDEELQEALYFTTLDLSFARKNACICVLFEETRTRTGLTRFPTGLEPDGARPFQMASLLGADALSIKFQDIHRAVRAEVCAVNGVTILDRTGTIRAVGVPLRENGPDAAVSKGFSVNISGQGPISLYKNDTPSMVFM